MRYEKYIPWLIASALIIKASLFLYILFANSSSVIQIDSIGYLADAKAWAHYLTVPSDGLRHSLYRTPGYSLFLALFHLVLRLPIMAIIFFQLVLNLMTACVVFKTVSSANRQLGLLSAAIVLLDLPTTIFSTMLLTESLYLFVISLFIYNFVRYINERTLRWLLRAMIYLAISVYIRPIGYFLGIAVAAFILYLWGKDKLIIGVKHAMLFLVLVYASLGIWQYHNLKIYGEFKFSSIDKATIAENGIIGRYNREIAPKLKKMPPFVYYIDSITRNFLELMTTPGNMKNFHSKAWEIFGVAFGYLFVVFWWVGCLGGFQQYKGEIMGQFLLLVLLYFISVSLISTGWHVTPRFRVPMVPEIALLSAQGWLSLVCFLKKYQVSYKQ